MANTVTIHQKITDLYLSGKAPSAIARELGIKARDVHTYVYKARTLGKIPSVQLTAKTRAPRSGVKLLRYHLKPGGQKIGCIYDIVDSLTPAQIKWLAKITPEGATVSDSISALITDAFLDDLL